MLSRSKRRYQKCFAPSATPKATDRFPSKEIPQFMKTLSNRWGGETTKLALLLLIYTFVRTGELRFAKWNEFEGLDGPEPLWRIPAERMKLRRPHLVPFPPAASAIGRLHTLTGKKAHLFPAPTKTGTMSENTMLFRDLPNGVSQSGNSAWLQGHSFDRFKRSSVQSRLDRDATRALRQLPLRCVQFCGMDVRAARNDELVGKLHQHGAAQMSAASSPLIANAAANTVFE